MDVNLDTLKREILEYLEAESFTVFRSTPGGLEGLPLVVWDSEQHPDYQMFLATAKQTGAKLILFATQEFDSSEIDEVLEELEHSDMERDERREFQSRLNEMRVFEGVTCSLEVAFDHHTHFYVYEVRPDWYEEYLNIGDEIAAHLPEHEHGDDSLGGYFSNN